MKLLTHTGLFMVTMSMILFFLFGVSFYFVFKHYAASRLEDELRQDMVLIQSDPQFYMIAVDAQIPFFDRIEYFIPESLSEEPVGFYDSLLFVANQQAYLPVRYVRFFCTVEDTPVEFRIYKSTISSDDLTERIGGLITLMAILFALGLYLLNRHVFSRTWKGFYQALGKVRLFKAGDPVPLFEENEIDEFEELNAALAKMTRRMEKDYHNLKSFTSHATHEFQTPLAVIMSKADLLLQNENYSETQYLHIQAIQNYARQLSRLTQALSLLYRIDNQQFPDLHTIQLQDLVRKHMHFIEEQCEMRGLQLILVLDETRSFQMHPDLADILFLNLIRNALNHNIAGGSIRIVTQSNQLLISNPGPPEALQADRIFKEFEKGPDSSGLGLGLSIVAKIVQIYPLKIDYQFDNQTHTFSLTFSS